MCLPCLFVHFVVFCVPVAVIVAIPVVVVVVVVELVVILAIRQFTTACEIEHKQTDSIAN